MKVRAYVAVGSNLGDRRKNIRRAEALLEEIGGIRLLRQSPLYETDPVGGMPQGKFLNGVWEIETSLTGQALLDRLLGIERSLGRRRTVPHAPRTIDLDILSYGDRVLESKALTVPHPRLHERWFVLRPLADLAPDWMHPTRKKTVQEMLEGLS